MSEVKANVVAGTAPDLLNALAGIEAGSPMAALRGQRAEIAGFIQASYDALLEPANEAGVSRVERGLIAYRIARLEGSQPLIAYYREYLARQEAPAELVAASEKENLGAPLSSRIVAVLEHVDRLTKEPGVATPDDLAGLKAQGLNDANIVTISQLIAFLSFQVRALVGLQLLAEGL